MVSISKEIKLAEISLLKNKALAAKDSEMTHLWCPTMHKLITGLPLESSQ
jgi:hypothetical protein